jgi:hypothetical protein
MKPMPSTGYRTSDTQEERAEDRRADERVFAQEEAIHIAHAEAGASDKPYEEVYHEVYERTLSADLRQRGLEPD